LPIQAIFSFTTTILTTEDTEEHGGALLPWLRWGQRGKPFSTRRTAAEGTERKLFCGRGEDDGGAEFDGAIFFVAADGGVDFSVDGGPVFRGHALE
jgi:hypothetical protein